MAHSWLFAWAITSGLGATPRAIRRSYSPAALAVIYDGHWWLNFTPPAEEAPAKVIDGSVMSDDALMAMFR